MFLLSTDINFPSGELAGEDGLLAMGGDLSPERLIEAYRNGIFPWYSEGEPICWWCPDPRFVLFPPELKISKSMQGILKEDNFRFTINKDFAQVIQKCKSITRSGQEGTWISKEVQQAYTKLHELGIAHSAETWLGDELVGGLYGIRLGKVFFGESMFSSFTNASKFAFIKYVEHLLSEDVKLIDCQVHTKHLESFGARMIERKDFLKLLETYC